MSKLSHVDESGRASMVDVSQKPASERIAVAEAIIAISQETFDLVLVDAPGGVLLLTREQAKERVRDELRGLDLVGELLADRRRQASADRFQEIDLALFPRRSQF